jgi:hypothetical protein
MEIHNMKTGFEVIPVEVPTNASEVKETGTYRTDKDHRRVLGVALSIGNAAALPNSKIGIRVNGEEVTPKNFEAKFLHVTTGAVPPNDAFYYFGPIDIDESEVDIRWEDGGSLAPASYADTLYLYLLCEKRG